MSESLDQPRKKLTIPELAAKKAAGERLAMVAGGLLRREFRDRELLAGLVQAL
jgi:hypothetical protein